MFLSLWLCQAAAELRLISQKQDFSHITRKTNHTYSAKENVWGYSCFMTWAVCYVTAICFQVKNCILGVLVCFFPTTHGLTFYEYALKKEFLTRPFRFLNYQKNNENFCRDFFLSLLNALHFVLSVCSGRYSVDI